jgi:four helix bundle protein
MSTITKFEDLEVWQLARELCKDIFEITSTGEFCKDYGLKNQIRDSSGSVMDNISEGFERDGTNEFKQFLSYSKGSVGEVRSQLYRALNYKYISLSKFDELNEKTLIISKKLSNLMNYLSKTDYKGRKYKAH